MATASSSEIARFEGALFAAWPPTLLDHIGPWRLHFGDGHTGRRNSAQPIGDPGIPLAEAVARVAAWYRERHLHPSLRVTPLAPPDLETLLARLGYQSRAETLVVAGPARAAADADATVDQALTDQWLAARFDIGGVAPSERDKVARPYRDAGPVSGFGALGDPPAAVGMGVVHDDLIGVYSVVVHPQARRRGLGRRLTEHLVAWGAGLGADTVYLQVEEANEPARSLYSSMGLEAAYRYRYWER